jgi:Leucine-rich repeat (LRR) protein
VRSIYISAILLLGGNFLAIVCGLWTLVIVDASEYIILFIFAGVYLMKILFALTSISILLLSAIPLTRVSAQQANTKSFATWCQERNSAPTDTKHTIDELLIKAGTKDCQQADTKLKSISELYLSNVRIKDLKPLASLTNLKALFLNSNQISDLKPLASLTNLKGLDLNDNQISNIKPLASLTNLKTLFLNANRISDIKPLASLKDLVYLEFHANQISDVKPLASLRNLTGLDLNSNQISDVKPLASLNKLTELKLSRNQISDVKPLSSLKNLTDLYLSHNQLEEKDCPVKPKSCRFDL